MHQPHAPTDACMQEAAHREGKDDLSDVSDNEEFDDGVGNLLGALFGRPTQKEQDRRAEACVVTLVVTARGALKIPTR
jgi:hypothetical protein